MKRLLIIAVLFLSGCSTIDKIKEVWPRAHDPVMVSAYIDLDIYLDEINCKSPNSIDFAKERAIYKIIFTSSVAVYGLNKNNPDENINPEKT